MARQMLLSNRDAFAHPVPPLVIRNLAPTSSSTMSTLKQSLRGLHVVAYSKLKQYPWIFLPIGKLRESRKKKLVRRSTEIVIEGCTRCGSHPAVYAFLHAQRKAVDLSHHYHAPAPLMLAARWGVPAILLIREPIEPISSATVYRGDCDPMPHIKVYINFHAPLVKYADKLVISDFSTTTGDFGAVIAEVNRRFDRQFDLYDETPENRAGVNRLISQEHADHMGGRSERIPLPTAAKAEAKAVVAERLKAPRFAKALAEAQRLYDFFAERAVAPRETVPVAAAISERQVVGI